MTINAVSKSVSIVPSSDGKLYSKYPTGNAIGVSPWSWEGLESGLSGLTLVQNNGNSIVWHEEDDGFARCTANAQGMCAIQYFVPVNTSELRVKFQMRRHTSNRCSKVLKCPSKGAPTYPSNVTVGGHGGYQSNEIRIAGYSDRSNGGDSQTYVRMDGVRSTGTAREAPTFATTSASQVYFPIDGAFHDFEFWVKFNSDNTADGEFAVWLDDVLLLHMTDVWNCATTTSDGTNPGVSAGVLTQYQYRNYVGVCEYFNNTGFYEDYRALKIGYTRPAGLP